MARQDGATGARRKGRGFTPAAKAAAPLLRGAGAKRGFAEQRLMTQWPALVGPALATLCRPVKMSFRRGDGLGATLVVEAEGPAALEIQHQAPALAERVNAVYGYRAVERIKVVQTAPRGGASGFLGEPAPAFEGPPPLDGPVSPDISGVENPGLRAALARLEANIRRRRQRDADRTGADR
jgi:hypothetical protein